MITVLIIDGEPLVRDHLARMLEVRPGFRVVGKLRSASEAVRALRDLRPDIVILDLDLPDAGDLDPWALRERDPATVLILTTVHEHPSPRPVHLHAFDSLLKPFDSQRFDRVLARSAAYLGKGDRLKGQHLRLLAAYPQDDEREVVYADRLLVRDGERIRFVKVEDIDRIEAGGGCARVHSGGRIHLLAESIDDLASRLDPRQFLSVRRSLLINLDRIEPLGAVR
ncbi:MAG TPA: LytTR family DNA-binding domain-containing protein [Gemmatimonadota bacterium]|nr:LytTR family DNA-binding domain-containing protein [Gemmatimonadota bacterium]